MASLQMVAGLLLIGVAVVSSGTPSSVIFFSVMGLIFFVKGAKSL